MATIAHLSDVHFGRHDPAVVAAVETFLADKRPDLVVISGDFTQRARVAQYREAGAFVDRIEAMGLTVLAVPGNHDVPLYDVMRRFVLPLDRYRRFIDDDLCPWFASAELEVLGINTARSLTIKDGSVSRAQIRLIRKAFAGPAEGRTRILVTHHPLHAMPIGDDGVLTEVADRNDDALAAAAEAGVHILLAGHFHRAFSKSAREMVDNAGAALVVQAGTATSTRLRGGETQSFNWIEAVRGKVDIEVQAWNGVAFAAGKPAEFSYDGDNWHFAGTPAPVADQA